jgi:hypothetical protein
MPICGQIFALFGRYHVPYLHVLVWFGLICTCLKKEMKGKCIAPPRDHPVFVLVPARMDKPAPWGRRAVPVLYILYLNKWVILPQKLFFFQCQVYMYEVR